MSKLNILIAIESFWDGGAEMFAIRLANELAVNNKVFFLELYPYKTTVKRQIKFIDDKNVKLFQIGKNFIGCWLAKKKNSTNTIFGRLANSLQNKICDYQTKSIFLNFQINIVNSHSWDTDFYFSKFKNKIDFSLVSTFHGHYEYLSSKRKNFYQDTKSSLSKIDHVIYTASKHCEMLDSFQYSTKKRHKIFYGITSEINKNLTIYDGSGPLKLIMVARGIEEKGWEQLIIAVLFLLKKYPNKIKLQLVGESEYLNTLKDKYPNVSIEFLGHSDRVIELIKKSHIGILPTYYSAESLPNSVIEYLICGKPVVTSNVGAIKEMIGINEISAGYCLELNNGKIDINEIIKAIESYLLDPSIVQLHSGYAIKAAQKFTMNSCVKKYIETFLLDVQSN